MEATVLSTEGELRLSRKLLKGAQARQRLALAVENTLPVEGTVTRETKGGYEVTVAGLRAFCPFSQMSLHRPDSPEEFLNQTFEFYVTQYSERNIVLSAAGSSKSRPSALQKRPGKSWSWARSCRERWPR